MPDSEKPARREGNAWTALGLVATLGVTVTVPVVAGIFFGKLLQAKMGAGPKIMAACILGGVFAGLAAAVLQLMRESGWKR